MRTLAIAEGVAWRMLHNFFHNKALLIPSLVFPLFFFAAFAGGLSRISHVPGFDFPAGYTAFQFAFVVLQSAAFAVSSPASASPATSRAASPGGCCSPPRTARGIVLGYLTGALVRWFTTASLITIIAFAVRMNVGGSGVDLFGLYLLGIVVNIAATLWAAGVAMRLRSMQAGPMMQVPVFLVLFFAPVYVPLALLQRLDPRCRRRQPDDAHPRDGPKLRRGSAVRGRRGVPRRLRARRPVFRLGHSRPSQSRSSRLARFNDILTGCTPDALPRWISLCLVNAQATSRKQGDLAMNLNTFRGSRFAAAALLALSAIAIGSIFGAAGSGSATIAVAPSNTAVPDHLRHEPVRFDAHCHERYLGRDHSPQLRLHVEPL